MEENNTAVAAQGNTEAEPAIQTTEEKLSEQFSENEAVVTTPAEGEAEVKAEDVPPELGDDWIPTLPEGVSVDEVALKEARTLMKEMKLSPDNAQKLAEFQSKQVQAMQAKTAEAWEKQVSTWEADVKNDPAFKDDFEGKRVIAEKGFKALFSAEEREWLSKTGMSSYLFRAMYKAGEKIAEPMGEIESKAGKLQRSADPYKNLEQVFDNKK